MEITSRRKSDNNCGRERKLFSSSSSKDSHSHHLHCYRSKKLGPGCQHNKHHHDAILAENKNEPNRKGCLKHHEPSSSSLKRCTSLKEESSSTRDWSPRHKRSVTTTTNRRWLPSFLNNATGGSSSNVASVASNALQVNRATSNLVLAKEKKAAKQLGVIVGAFVLCWLPYFTLFMVVAYCGTCVNQTVFTTSIWFGYFNSALNPFLYPMCNANFKRAFKRMLRLDGGGGGSGGGGNRGFMHHTSALAKQQQQLRERQKRVAAAVSKSTC